MIIKITQSQKEYIVNNLLESKKLLSIFDNSSRGNDVYYIDITEDEADKIRDLCCDKLDEVGFDEKYELTDEGRILEELIDVFYIKQTG